MTDESDFNLLQEGEFQSKYEPKEILGRSVGQYNKLCTCSNKTNNYIACCRGLSSIVRKCISRESGLEFAVKIIDKSQDDAIKESIDAEVEILQYLPPHPNISESHVLACSNLK